MAENKMSIEESKFKKIKIDREDWLLKGKQVLSINSDMESLVNTYMPDGLVLDIREIDSLSKDTKVVTLASLDGNSLPPFKAGQYIDIDINIKDLKCYGKFAILSSPKEAISGIYKILIKKGLNETNDYLFKLKKGDEVNTSLPYGEFTFNVIRDKKDVIAIVNELGILPVLSMAKAIRDGLEDFNLTIFYTEKSKKDLLFENELFEICNRTPKIDVKIILFEDTEGYEKGYVTLDMLRNILVEANSFFISGSEGLVKYLDKELSTLNLPKKFFRYDKFLPKCIIKKESEYNLSLYIKNEKYEMKCYNNKTIIDSILESGIFLKDELLDSYSKCELVKGKVKVINDIRTDAEKEYNFIHPSMTYPMGDIEIIVR